MPLYDFVCEDCGRPVDDLVDERCAECREEGEFTTFTGSSKLVDALTAWCWANDVPVPEAG